MKYIYIWLNVSYGYRLSESTQISLTVDAENTAFETIKREIMREGQDWSSSVTLDSIIFGAKFKDHKINFDKFNGGEDAFEQDIIKAWNNKYC